MSKTNYAHILLATDLSNDEKRLHKRTLELREHYQAKLTIIHVVHDILAYSGMYGCFSAGDINEQIYQEAKSSLIKLGKKLGVEKENLLVTHGNTKDKIIETAERLNCDLVIIGGHTKNGLERLIGSTANSVIQGANCDVLVVKCPN